jgi:hypothetical protein
MGTSVDTMTVSPARLNVLPISCGCGGICRRIFDVWWLSLLVIRKLPQNPAERSTPAAGTASLRLHLALAA